ncbi:MAG: folate-binding protein YgfZ [Burkholderiales bacterium PBB1]|nr:MAG: folate-binding protein YgfZ [Burkholderiales bacterium PBB1]
MSLPVLSSLSVPLSHWGVIRAVGADAAPFLHGQLTQDVQTLGPHQARLAGYCSPKGRLLASFVIWKPSDNEVLMACHASVLPATLKRLSMFVLRAQCRLSDASAEVALTGVSGAAAQTATQDLPTWGHRADEHGSWIRLPGVAGIARAWRVANNAAPRTVDPLALSAWQRLEVDSGIVTIEAATVDQFVPQMLNFELIGAVNFQKGCYPGQEVVARSQYRGTTKRRTLLFAAEAPIAAGREVFHSADPTQPAGLVACAAPAPDDAAPLTHRALIEVKLAALEGGTLHLGAPDGALLTRCPMPYEVLNAETA